LLVQVTPRKFRHISKTIKAGDFLDFNVAVNDGDNRFWTKNRNNAILKYFIELQYETA